MTMDISKEIQKEKESLAKEIERRERERKEYLKENNENNYTTKEDICTPQKKIKIKCKLCNAEIDESKQYLINNKLCIACYRKNRREWARHRTLKSTNKKFVGLDKREHTDCCELCNNNKVQLVYHHWNDTSPDKGIWVCGKCHRFAEVIDHLDENRKLLEKYLKIKKKIDEDKQTKLTRQWKEYWKQTKIKYI